MKKIGFIGLGLMGKPMAKNLIKAGFSLTVNSRSRAPVDELVTLGARAAATPREVALASDVVITIVPDSTDVEKVALGENGLVAAKRNGLIHIDMSTISPIVTQRIAEIEKQNGMTMLDAPVSGGTVGAEGGTLSIMVGGDEAAFNSCAEIFAAMGRKITYMGASGAGQTTKACNQIMTGGIYAVMSEALVLAAKSGLDPAKVVEVLVGGAARCWALEVRAPKILKRELNPGFKASMQLKDLRIVGETAHAVGVSTPMTALAREMYEAMVIAGDGDLDNSAVVTVWERMAGVEVKSKQ